MKKVKQILAILGIVLLVGINILLVFAAGTTGEDSMNVFNAAIVTVVVVPVLLWVYLFVFKLIKKNNDDKKNIMETPDEPNEGENSQEE